jgi:prevent-host-death family protein
MSDDTVNIHFAKTHLSRLIERVSSGATVVIANAGHPVARLVPYAEPPRAVRVPGALANRGFGIVARTSSLDLATVDSQPQADGA